MGWEYTDFQRDELYEQMWTEAVSKVAKRYGISDVGLRKIFRRSQTRFSPTGQNWRLVGAGRRPELRRLYSQMSFALAERFIDEWRPTCGIAICHRNIWRPPRAQSGLHT
jgi:hypothetical protein